MLSLFATPALLLFAYFGHAVFSTPLLIFCLPVWLRIFCAIIAFMFSPVPLQYSCPNNPSLSLFIYSDVSYLPLYVSAFSAGGFSFLLCCYEQHSKGAGRNSVCASCRRFVPVSEIVKVDNKGRLLDPLYGYLDHRGRQPNNCDICLSCPTSLS